MRLSEEVSEGEDSIDVVVPQPFPSMLLDFIASR